LAGRFFAEQKTPKKNGKQSKKSADRNQKLPKKNRRKNPPIEVKELSECLKTNLARFLE